MSVQDCLVLLLTAILDGSGEYDSLEVGGKLLSLCEGLEPALQLLDDVLCFSIGGLGDSELAEKLDITRVRVLEFVAEPVDERSEERLEGGQSVAFRVQQRARTRRKALSFSTTSGCSHQVETRAPMLSAMPSQTRSTYISIGF